MFEYFFNNKKMLPIDIRTRVHNLKVEMAVMDNINKQLIKKNAELEERIMKLEKIYILSKIE